MNITTYDVQELTFNKFTFEGVDDIFNALNISHEQVHDHFYEIEQDDATQQRNDLFSIEEFGFGQLESDINAENQLPNESQNEDYEYFQGSLFDAELSMFHEQSSNAHSHQIEANYSDVKLNNINSAFMVDDNDIFKVQKSEHDFKVDEESSKCLTKKTSSSSSNKNENTLYEQMVYIQNKVVEKEQEKPVASVKSLKNKKNQLRTKLATVNKNSVNSDIDLSQRRDVINKTILRILRRYFTQLFKDSFDEQFKSKVAKSEWYFECIKEFCFKLFGKKHEMIDEIQYYMASIIMPKNVTKKDMVEGQVSQEQFDAFHNCLYKYSHTKLVNLLEIKPLGVIYEKFFNGPLDDLLQSETSVLKNYQLYMVVFKEFFEIFSGAADVSTLVLN